MALVSRRDLISAGAAASASALFPQQIFALTAHAAVEPAPLSESGQAEYLENSLYLPSVQTRILVLVRNTLTKLFAGRMLEELESDNYLSTMPPASRVNVTLRHAGRLRGSMSAPGTNLGRQVIDAVYYAAMDRSYGGHLTQWEIPETVIEVWIQIGSSEIGPGERLAEGFLLLGIDGLEIETRGQLAYFLPSFPITSKYKSEDTILDALCRKAGLPPDAWLQSDLSVRKTQWLCVPSVRNARVFGQESGVSKLPFPLESSIDESASYLIRNQDANGCTAYLYDPISDVFVGKSTNLVRSAGCLLALSQVLESNHRLARDANFKACTVKMARGLLNLTSETGDGMRILREEDADKIPKMQRAGVLPGDEEVDRVTEEEVRKAAEPTSIGATALLVAALSGDTLRKEFTLEYNQLYRSLVSAQRPDGCFLTNFGETEINARSANFYPGEALLALAMEAERKNSAALEMCRRAFQTYVLQFRAAPTSAFTVWHVNVWSRIALLTGEHAYADFAFEQTDWLLKLQIKNHRDARWVGGFSQSSSAPQIYSVAFTEAVVRALTLAIRIGDTARTQKYADCVRSGLRFCRFLRIEETQASLLGDPSRCKGGVAFGLVDRRIRCDSVQHFITLCLAVEQIKDHLL